MQDDRTTAVACLACGEATQSDNRRNLTTAASKHIVPAWRAIATKELEKRQQHADLDGLLSVRAGFMCQRCFYAYEKVQSLHFAGCHKYFTPTICIIVGVNKLFCNLIGPATIVAECTSQCRRRYLTLPLGGEGRLRLITVMCDRD